MILVGTALYLLTAFTVLWLVGAICVGVFAEMIVHLSGENERQDYQRALAWWQAAYYCTQHTRVLIAGEPKTYSPAEFAQLLTRGQQAPGPVTESLSPAAGVSNP